MQPITTYIEKKEFAQRMYSLQDGKIKINGKRTARGDFEVEIALKNLRLPKDVIYRTGDFAQAVAMLPGLILLIGILIFGAKICSYFRNFSGLE